MASKKRTRKHHDHDDNSGDDGPETTPTEPPISVDLGAPDGKLTDEQKVRLNSANLLPRANTVLQNIEDRMMALIVMATARWQPATSLLETDENSSPIMGDDEYSEFLALVENMAEHAMFREVALFMGLPEHVVDEVLLHSLRGAGGSTPAALKKAARPFSMRQARTSPVDLSR